MVAKGKSPINGQINYDNPTANNNELDEQNAEEVYFLGCDSESQVSIINIEEEEEKEEFNAKDNALKLIIDHFENKSQQQLLINLLNANDPMISTCMHCFENSHDEEDFLDNLQRILRKFDLKPKKEIFDQKQQKEIIFPENTKKQTNPFIKPNKNNEEIKEEKEIPPLKVTQKQQENSQEAIKSSPRKPFDLQAFLKSNEDKFTNEEFGMVLNMQEKADEELKAIVYQCQNIKNQEVL